MQTLLEGDMKEQMEQSRLAGAAIGMSTGTFSSSGFSTIEPTIAVRAK